MAVPTATAERRATEGDLVANLRERLEIDGAIDAPIESMRDRIYAALRGFGEEIKIWADDSPAVAKPDSEIDGIIDDAKKAVDLVEGLLILNGDEVSIREETVTTSNGPERIAEIKDGRLVLVGKARDLALDWARLEAASVLEEGAAAIEKGMDPEAGARKAQAAYDKAEPIMDVIGQILDVGIEDEPGAHMLHHSARVARGWAATKVGEELCRQREAQRDGDAELARESGEEAQEAIMRALLIERVRREVEQFWASLKEGKV